MRWLCSVRWRIDLSQEVTLSSQLIYEGRAVRLRVDTVRVPSGRETTREIVEHSDCVAVIALDAEDNVLLVNQFRKPVEKALLEIPAGGIEPGEDAEATVRRELREEIGYLPRKVERLGGFYSTPGYCTEYLHLYLATDLVPSPLNAEDTEGIEVVRVPISQLRHIIASGDICDAKSIAGLLTFLDFKRGRAD
jgi:ADP-ribose pyrophosphatase